MRRSLLALAVLLTIAYAGPAPPDAHAETYTVWSCANGLGKPLSAGDWTPTTTGLTSSTCGSSTGVVAGNLQAVTGSTPGQGATMVRAGWATVATTGTKVAGLDVWWSNSASVQSPGRIEVFAGGLNGARSLYLRDAGSAGNGALPFDEANHQSFSGLSDDAVSLIAWCLTGCDSSVRSISAFFNAYRMKVTVSDVDVPTGTAGGITEGQVIDAPVVLTGRASDVGGGVRDLQLLVDGKVVDSKEVGGQCADIDPTTGDSKDYAVMRPCAATFPAVGAADASFTLTPAALATAGPHKVEVVAHDAAGNTGTLLSNTVVVTPALLDGSATPGGFDPARNLFFNPDRDTKNPARLNGVPTGEPPGNVLNSKLNVLFVVKKTVRVKGKRRVIKRYTRRRTVGFNTAVRLRARLTTATGAPIVGARVYQALSVAGDQWALSPIPLITTKTGRISFVMPAKTPSRLMQLVYFPSTDSNMSFRSPGTLLAVRAPVSMRLSKHRVKRGVRVTVTARLRAGARPGQSVLGALQVRDRRGWRPIRQVRFKPSSKGRVKIVLRLRTRGAYPLRVRVPTQTALRFHTGASRTGILRIR